MVCRRALLIGTIVPLAAAAAVDSTSPIGLWRTIDDHTGRERGLVRIFASNGALYGRVERIFDPKKAAARCEKCGDDRRGKPVLGLDIIRGLHADGGDSWSGGEILDPETGSTYRASIRLTDQGRKLIVRGSVLGGLIGRSQTWLRADSP